MAAIAVRGLAPATASCVLNVVRMACTSIRRPRSSTLGMPAAGRQPIPEMGPAGPGVSIDPSDLDVRETELIGGPVQDAAAIQIAQGSEAAAADDLRDAAANICDVRLRDAGPGTLSPGLGQRVQVILNMLLDRDVEVLGDGSLTGGDHP
jgi:hypothetical protein